MIYISEVFEKISKTCLLVVSLFFVNDLRFIARGNLVKEIVKTIEKVAETFLEKRLLNSVTYDIEKRVAVLFSKLY